MPTDNNDALLDQLESKYQTDPVLDELEAKYSAEDPVLDQLEAKYQPLGERIDDYNAENGMLRQFGRGLKRGGLNLANLFETGQAREASRIAQGETRGVNVGPLGLNFSDRMEMRGADPQVEAEDRTLSLIQSIVERGNRISDIPQNPVVEAIGNAETFGEGFEAFKEAPIDATMNVTAESLPLMAPGLAAGVINPALGAMVMGGSSFGIENQAGFLDSLQKSGVDVSDPAALREALNDPEIRAEAERVGLISGGIIGTLDAASAGLASKSLVPRSLVAGVARREAGNLAAQTGAQITAGAGGEALKQVATEGEITDPGGILLEGIGELGTAPVEVAAFSRDRLGDALTTRRENKAAQTTAEPDTAPTPEPPAVDAPTVDGETQVKPKQPRDDRTPYNEDGVAMDSEFPDTPRPGVLLDEQSAAEETSDTGDERLFDDAAAETSARADELGGESSVAADQQSEQSKAPRPKKKPGPLSYKRSRVRQSLFNRVYVEAGKDPEKMRAAGAAAQYNVLRSQVKEQYGFSAILKDKNLQWREANDALMDAYENMDNVAAALSLPRKALTLNSKIPLTLRKSAGGAAAFFVPGTNEIGVVRRNDSYAHELAHAIDFALLDTLGFAKGKPERGAGLSGKSKQGLNVAEDTSPKAVGEAFDNLMTAMFRDDAQKAKTIRELELKLETTTDKAELSAIRKELRRVRKNMAPESSFYVGLKAIPGNQGKYYRTPTEMFARVVEAYVANQIAIHRGDTDFVTGTDEFYTEANRRLNKIYPEGEDRQRIFDALRELFDTMRNEQLFGTAEPPPFRENSYEYTYLDPMKWQASARPAELDPITRGVINKAKKFAKQETERHLRDVGEINRRWDRSKKEWRSQGANNWQRTARTVQNFLSGGAFSGEGVFDHLAKRYPKSRAIRDLQRRLATKPGSGKFTGRTYSEDVEVRLKQWTNRVRRLVKKHDIQIDSESDARELRDRLTSETELQGNSRFDALASDLRGFLDRMYYEIQRAGIDVGYTRNGFLPRVLDIFEVEQNQSAFLEAAKAVYIRDVERKTEAAQAAAEKKGEDFTPPDPAEVEKVAELKAAAWLAKLLGGSTLHQDPNAPAANSLNSRTLPPEADQILADFYVKNPIESIEHYLEQMSRRVAFTERFGKTGEILDNAYKQMTREGVAKADIDMLRRTVDVGLGQTKTHLPDRVTGLMSFMQALYIPTMLPRATLSSLAEPVTAAIRSGDMRDAFRVWGPMISQAAAKMSGNQTELAEFAEALGVVTDAMTDQLMVNRFGGSFADSEFVRRHMSKFFQRTGLFAYTRASRIGVVNVANISIRKWADIRLNDKSREGAAIAELNELGVPKAQQKAFSEWLLSHDGRPSIGEIEDTDMGDLYTTAVNRFVDEVIQNPKPLNRPALAANPFGRLMFGIMSFAYTFQRNVLQRAYRRTKTAVKGKTEDGTEIGAYDRAVGMSLGMLPGFATLFGLQLAVSVFREALTNPDRFEDAGDDFWDRAFSEKMLALGFTRAGYTGAFDPAVQAFTGLKYQRDVSNVMVGAVPGYFAQGVQYMAQPFINNSENTNTAERNAAKGFYQTIMSPAIVSALTWAPGGVLTTPLYGAGMMSLTTPAARDTFADAVAGEKEDD